MKLVEEKEFVSEIKQIAEKHTGPFVVALDGRSGTGKTTLSRQIEKDLNASVITCDDFYTGGTLENWAKKTPKEKAENVIDWKRIRNEALIPLLNGRVATWHPFDWQTGFGLSEKVITCRPKKLIILDGAYSSRVELSELVNMSVLIELHDPTRRQRLKEREGEPFVESWHPVWDESEDYYFTQVRPPSSFDFVIRSL